MNATTTKPTLLFFMSERDGRCRRVEGYLAQVLQRRRNHASLSVRTLDTETRPDLARRFLVKQVPTLIVVDQKVVLNRLVKPTGCYEIRAFLDPWLR